MTHSWERFKTEARYKTIKYFKNILAYWILALSLPKVFSFHYLSKAKAVQERKPTIKGNGSPREETEHRYRINSATAYIPVIYMVLFHYY